MHWRQGVRQSQVDAPIGSCASLVTGALEGVHDGQDHGPRRKSLNERTAAVARSEGLEPEHQLQVNQLLSSHLLALAVFVPDFRRHLELRRYQSQQGWKRRFIDAKGYAGKSQLAKLDGETQPIAGSLCGPMIDRSVSLQL